MKRTILFLFLFIILSTFVNSAPPFTTTITTSGTMEIRTFTSIMHEKNKNITWAFLVTNSSGLKMDNTTADCYFRAYTPDYEVICDRKLGYDGKLFSFTANGSNCKGEGEYPYFAWCNNSVEGGSLEGKIIVTDRGYDYSNFVSNQDTSVSVAVIAFFLILTALVFCYPMVIKVKNKILQSLIDWSGFMLGLGMLLLTTTVTYAIADNAYLGVNKELSFVIITLSWMIPMIGFITTIYFIFKLVNLYKEVKYNKRYRLEE